MLQAREYACILILAAAIALPAPACAQQDDGAEDPQTLQRLGDKPVENEYELDVTVPPNTVTPPPPESPEQRAAREAFERQAAIERNLASAAGAEREGRIDQPPGDCAWFYYRSVLDLDAANQEAEQGLVRLQDDMIGRALKFAGEMDFESAERLLEEALLVREDRAPVDQAYEQIREIRLEHAGDRSPLHVDIAPEPTEPFDPERKVQLPTGTPSASRSDRAAAGRPPPPSANPTASSSTGPTSPRWSRPSTGSGWSITWRRPSPSRTPIT